MTTHSVFSSDYGTVEVDPRVPCLFIHWHEQVRPSDIIFLLQRALEYAEAHVTPLRAWGWVSDTRWLLPFPPQARKWVQQVFTPRIQALGICEISLAMAGQSGGRFVELPGATPSNWSFCSQVHVRLYASLEEAKAGAQRAVRHI